MDVHCVTIPTNSGITANTLFYKELVTEKGGGKAKQQKLAALINSVSWGLTW